MKRAILVLIAGGLLAGLSGCVFPHGRDGTGLINGSCQKAPENAASVEDDGDCNDPNGERCRRCCGRGRDGMVDPGPPAAAVTYPYYTVRGPRDFLARNPASIGP